MRFQLETKISAFNKISPNILSGYVTQETLDTELKKYVQDVGQNGENTSDVFGRTAGKWVKLNENVVDPTVLRWGVSQIAVMDEVNINILANSRKLEPDGQPEMSCDIPYTLPEDGYMWICSSKPLASWKAILTPQWKVGCDYVNTTKETGPIEAADGVRYYCYRTQDALSANNPWDFVVNIDMRNA